MKSPKKIKSVAVQARVAQSREEAVAMIAELGKVQRQIDGIELAMNSELAAIKAAAAKKAMPLADRVSELQAGIQTWCEANRAALTDGGKVKSADLGTGKVLWRTVPASVKLKGVEDILRRIREGGDLYKDFLRTTYEVDKVGMLRNPNLARQIEGVRIDSAGEEFAIEPFADETLPGAA